MNVVAYLRVSTDEQVQSGLGLDAQRTAVEQEAVRRGWSVTWEADEGVSGKLRNRPALDRALARLRAGEAQALVVAKMDRLGRSVIQASDVLETARRQKWGPHRPRPGDGPNDPARQGYGADVGRLR